MRIVTRSVDVVAAVFLLVCPGPVAFGQTTQSPDSILTGTGQHIRVHRGVSDRSPIVGRFRAIEGDSVLIAPDADTSVIVALSRRDIARLEVERDANTRDQFVTVMAVVGTVAGGTAAVVRCVNNRPACAEEVQETQRAYENDSTYWGPSLLLTLGGTLAGALLGYAMAPAPHWDVVALPMRTSGRDGSLHWGLRIGMRYSLGPRSRSARRS